MNFFTESRRKGSPLQKKKKASLILPSFPPMCFWNPGWHTRADIHTYIHNILENLDRLTHRQIAESHSFLLPPSFFPTFLKYVYPHVLCCSRNNAVRVSHPRRTSLRNVSFVLLTNLPGPARVLAPYRMERVESGGREGEREKIETRLERPRVHGNMQRRIPTKKRHRFG